ncbi:MAG TPA: papain-like cysteine protease family protein [Thermoanaerobaculia bacterium]|nr:papain-like cysteine protease family protein [Thermoanaerobaculia bacterium]
MPLPKFIIASMQPLTKVKHRAAASGGAAPASISQLNLNMQHQQQTNWCWSAVSVSVKLFYTPGFAITQCDQANRQLTQTTCCANGSSNVCNVTWFLDRALTGLGNLAAFNGGTTPFANVVTQIGASRPLGCRIGWQGGGGHFVVIDGYTPGAANNVITVKDPIYGTSVIPYQTFATAYQGSGSWTHSYLTKP